MSHEPVVEYLPLDKLQIFPNVQRHLDQRKSAKMATEMHLDSIGMFCVNRRDNGALSLIDGQHRQDMLRINGWTNEKVACEVYSGLTEAEEAKMFRQRNFRTPVAKIDLFRIRVVEGDKAAQWLTDMLARHGWEVKAGTSDGLMQAVDALERVYRLDTTGAVVERTVATLTAAWGRGGSTLDGGLIGGFGLVFARYESEINSATFVEHLMGYPNGARALLGKARGLRELKGGTLAACVAEIAVKVYNQGLRSRKIADWRAE